MLPRYGPLGASSRLRMYQYLPALQAAGMRVDVVPLLDDGYVRDLYADRRDAGAVARGYWRRLRAVRGREGYDAIWLEKEAWPWLPDGLERALMPGGPALAVDYDDAVFHRYDRHRSALVRRLLGRKLDRLMRRADLVTAGNDYLAARARDAGCRRVEWLPTVVDLARYPPPSPPAAHAPAVVGWIGSPSTAGYLHAVSAALAPLQAEGLVRCVAVGARADQLAGTPFEARPWREDAEVEALRGFDIGIMPLPDGPWERGKCGYKLIQYMACGVPVVASPVGANLGIVAAGEHGWFAGTPAQWAQAVRSLAADPDLRARMGAAGRRRVEAVYSLQAQATRAIGMLRELGGPRACAD
ncbi:glycosyltransferase family 4 protein [Luteimonas sp. Y-2-2-4F]|nr:glycosyltransferase family 4 protein [Luteimonas sp. Y-2-2-4F]MCD9032754.1 glycosyltransferase family 4 protein [Luteimonas sp. Y-2-2-4F]